MAKLSSITNNTGGSKHVYFESPNPTSSEAKSRTLDAIDSETLGDSDSYSYTQSKNDLIYVSYSGTINFPDEETLILDPARKTIGPRTDLAGANVDSSPTGRISTGPKSKLNGAMPSKFISKTFADHISIRQSDELKIKPLQGESYNPDFLEFDEDELCDVPNEWGHCLLGCFAGKWPGMLNIKKLVNYWNVACEVLPYVNGCVIFRFTKLVDMEKFLQGGPFHCLGRPLLLKIFDFENPPKGVNCASVPVWVKFPFLPGKYWHPAAFSRLCHKIGSPVCSDRPTFEKTRPAFARLLVDVDPSKPPPKSIFLKQPDGSLLEQSVVIDFFPEFCKKCKNFGHFSDDCGSKKLAAPLNPKSGKKPLNKGKQIIETVIVDPEYASGDLLCKTAECTDPKTLPSKPSKEGKVPPSVPSHAANIVAGSMPPNATVDMHDPAIILKGEAADVPPHVITNFFAVLEPTETVQVSDQFAAAISEPSKAQNSEKLDKLPPGPSSSHNAEKQAKLIHGLSSPDACPVQISHEDDLEFSPALSKSAKKKLKKKNKKDETTASSSSADLTGKPEGVCSNPSGSGIVSSQPNIGARKSSLGVSKSTALKSTSSNVPINRIGSK